ncbi:MAG TPA: choice-of-anchor Q domain-containing protein [Candidatus Binatia bacterium]|nr:choice-of-anchor Q domain-containing protein [Candidatus Binatia bacterium]
MKKLAILAFAAFAVLRSLNSVHPAEFSCPSGDVTCLIAAINEANENGEENTISLEPGTYTLRTVDNNIIGPEGLPEGPNGLPSITGKITIRQNELGATIERDRVAQPFRLFHITSGGSLNLFGLGLRYGRDQSDFGGGAILNRGVVRIETLAIYENTKTTGPGLHTVGGAGISNLGRALVLNTDIADNTVTEDEFVNGLGGGIFNGFGAELEITGSFIYRNRSVRLGGGIFNGGDLRITATAIYENVAEDSEGFGAGGGIQTQAGDVIITNSTIARNQAFAGSGIDSTGEWTAVNTTIAGNGGLFDLLLGRTRASLQNSIIGRCFAHPDFGIFNSLGHNIVGDAASCDGHYEPTDRVTDPRLGEWNPDGGYFPPLPDSPAIDSANPDTCPETDQLGLPRVGPCDIGSVEFQDGRLLVSIDIRPKSDANKINPNSTKSINVAIFSVNEFDATSVDATTIRFGSTGAEAAPIHVARRDVDGDGTRDLVARFQIQDLGIHCGDTSASLTAQTSVGQSIIGSSPITTTGCKQRERKIALSSR